MSAASLTLTTGTVSKRANKPRKKILISHSSHSSRRRSAHRSRVKLASSSEDDSESDLTKPRRAV